MPPCAEDVNGDPRGSAHRAAVWPPGSGKVGVTLVTIGRTGIVIGMLPNAAVIVTVIGIIVAVRAYLG